MKIYKSGQKNVSFLNVITGPANLHLGKTSVKAALVHFLFCFVLICSVIVTLNFFSLELILSHSRIEPKLYLHKQCKSLPIQDTLNVTNVTGRADNNRLYGQRCSHGSIWDVFTKTAGIQHCSPETTSVHTRLKEPVHITEAVWWNRGHCPVLISTYK